jgi:mannose-1-phosphate guanylyltransferase
MKAFLLAAGLGTRLKPLTDSIPKCLLPIEGRPILEYWLSHLAKSGVTEVLVNTHHLHQQVESFAKSWKGLPILHLSYEENLLGSAGTILANKNFIKNDDFLVCYSDNYTRFDVSVLATVLKGSSALGVMALNDTMEPHRCGIVELDSEGWVTSFIEKPANPKSKLANAGMYAFSAKSLSYLEKKVPIDIAQDFIPKLIPRLIGLHIREDLIDIGTLEAYDKLNSSLSKFWVGLNAKKQEDDKV